MYSLAGGLWCTLPPSNELCFSLRRWNGRLTRSHVLFGHVSAHRVRLVPEVGFLLVREEVRSPLCSPASYLVLSAWQTSPSVQLDNLSRPHILCVWGCCRQHLMSNQCRVSPSPPLRVITYRTSCITKITLGSRPLLYTSPRRLYSAPFPFTTRRPDCVKQAWL